MCKLNITGNETFPKKSDLCKITIESKQTLEYMISNIHIYTLDVKNVSPKRKVETLWMFTLESSILISKGVDYATTITKLRKSYKCRFFLGILPAPTYPHPTVQ